MALMKRLIKFLTLKFRKRSKQMVITIPLGVTSIAVADLIPGQTVTCTPSMGKLTGKTVSYTAPVAAEVPDIVLADDPPAEPVAQ